MQELDHLDYIDNVAETFAREEFQLDAVKMSDAAKQWRFDRKTIAALQAENSELQQRLNRIKAAT